MSNQHLKYKLITLICLTVSTSFLVTGYLLAGWWQIFLIFPAVLLLWKIPKYQPRICVPSVLFSSYMFLASIGVWMGLVRYLMVYGLIMALAGWELQIFQRGWIGKSQHSKVGLLERYHLKSLSIVILLGFLITTIGLNLQVRLPFAVILSLVLFAGFLLERVYSYIHEATSQ